MGKRSGGYPESARAKTGVRSARKRARILPAAPAKAANAPITIVQCFVTVPKAFSNLASGTQIDFINVSKKVANNDVVFGGKTVQSCEVIKVNFVDGTVWNK